MSSSAYPPAAFVYGQQVDPYGRPIQHPEQVPNRVPIYGPEAYQVPNYHQSQLQGPIYDPPPQHHGKHNSVQTNASPTWPVDLETGADEAPAKDLTGDLPVSIRHGFIRKVYILLFIQLTITFGIALLFGLWTEAGDWLNNNSWLSIVAIVLVFVILIALVCIPGMAKRSPINLILLFAFSAIFGIVIGFLAVSVSIEAFLSAMGITTAVVFAVSIFACQTKWDFTGCGPFVFVALILLILFGIVAGIFHDQVVNIVYGSLGAALFSFFLVYDTQMIVGGKHRKYQYSIDDYVFAALSLYMDVINIFSYILLLMQNA